MHLTKFNICNNVQNLRRVASKFHTYALKLIRNEEELVTQFVSLTRKKPTQWQAAQEQYVASLPSESLYVSGGVDFDVKSGDFFFFDKSRWEIVELGAIGTLSARRRARAELRPS